MLVVRITSSRLKYEFDTLTLPPDSFASSGDMPDIIISKSPLDRPEISPSHGVFTNSTFTPISLPIASARSASNPSIAPELLMLSNGGYSGHIPTFNTPAFFMFFRDESSVVFLSPHEVIKSITTIITATVINVFFFIAFPFINCFHVSDLKSVLVLHI